VSPSLSPTVSPTPGPTLSPILRFQPDSGPPATSEQDCRAVSPGSAGCLKRPQQDTAPKGGRRQRGDGAATGTRREAPALCASVQPNSERSKSALVRLSRLHAATTFDQFVGPSPAAGNDVVNGVGRLGTVDAYAAIPAQHRASRHGRGASPARNGAPYGPGARWRERRHRARPSETPSSLPGRPRARRDRPGRGRQLDDRIRVPTAHTSH